MQLVRNKTKTPAASCHEKAQNKWPDLLRCRLWRPSDWDAFQTRVWNTSKVAGRLEFQRCPPAPSHNTHTLYTLTNTVGPRVHGRPFAPEKCLCRGWSAGQLKAPTNVSQTLAAKHFPQTRCVMFNYLSDVPRSCRISSPTVASYTNATKCHLFYCPFSHTAATGSQRLQCAFYVDLP